MDRNPVGWFEIYVQDMARARAFYERVLGTALTQLDAPADGLSELWAFPMTADAGGAGEGPKMPIGPYGFIALAYDPDGNLFGLHSMA